jgi:mono/diheme cytochrome c family protein
MDSQDREFEALLKRFQLRAPSPFPAEIQKVRRETARLWWAVPVVAAVVAIAIGVFWFSSFLGAFVTVEVAGDSSYKAGERVAMRTLMESGPRETFAWSLDDGSRVEMRARSSVSVEADNDGTGLRLNSGSVLVSAAKQKAGRFHVVTRDARVTGTTFLVEVQPTGTRIGVLEGEVEVRSGADVKKLRQGEQFTTASGTTLSPLTEAIAWSRRATELAALLPAPAPAAPIVAFTPAPPPRLTRTEIIPPTQPVQDGPQSAPPQPEPPQPPPAPAPERKPPQSDTGAEDPGAKIVARECGQCHRPDLAPSQPYASRAAVETLVGRQIAYGARVTQYESVLLVEYLLRRDGARPPRPRN